MVSEPTETGTTTQARTCHCYEQAVQILGKRWTGLLLSALLQGPQRFSELEIRIEGLSTRILSNRLRELEQGGIVQRVVYPEKPVRVVYTLTPKGYALQPAFEAISTWSKQWVELPVPFANDQVEESH